MTATTVEMDQTDLIRLAYRSVLRREPDPLGMANYLEFLKNHDFPELVKTLMDSPEFRSAYTVDFDSYDFTKDPRLLKHADENNRSLTELLRSTPMVLDEEQFSALAARSLEQFRTTHTKHFSELMTSYIDFHQRRFHLIDNIVCTLLRKSHLARAKILDFGYSINSLILANALPESQIFVCDQHRAWEVNKDFDAGSWIRERFFTLNLERDDLNSIDLRIRFDVIVFAEVLEHLIIHPAKIFRFLLRHLAPGGNILVTTPNFYREEVMRCIAYRKRFSVYPKEYTFDDHNHFHFMEYAMSDVLDFVADAGGRPSAYFFSDSIFTPSSDVPEDQLGNLIVLFSQG